METVRGFLGISGPPFVTLWPPASRWKSQAALVSSRNRW